MPFEQAFQAQTASQNELLRAKNVVGVAVGEKVSRGRNTGQEAVVVLVQRKLPIAALTQSDLLPNEIQGVPVDVVEIGYPRAYVDPLPPPTNPYDKIMGGVSIGHYKVTAGTLGAVVIDNETNQPVVLSNNHVIANSNDANIGDHIIHPAAYDGGTDADRVATLLRFQEIFYEGGEAPVEPPPKPSYGWAEIVRDGGNFLLSLGGVKKRRLVLASTSQNAPVTSQNASENRIDAAIGLPIDSGRFVRENRYIGQIDGTIEGYIGQQVRKAGRTTDYTEGTVTLLNATVSVGYGAERVAKFTGQLIISGNENTPDFSRGGDSGSVIVERDSQKAVGLLFAGSEMVTIANPINEVLSGLNVHF